MNDRPSLTSVRLAAGAAAAFTIAALIEIVAAIARHQPQPLAGIGFAAVAILWWAVVFRWKQRFER